MITIKKICAPILRDRSGDLSKRWYIEYYLEAYEGGQKNRKYIYINGCKTAAARYAKGAEIINNLTGFVPLEGNTFFNKLAALGAIEWRPATLRAYKTTISAFALFLGRRAPEKITEKDIQNFKIYLASIGKTYNTIAKYNNFLLHLYSKAFSLGLIDRQPLQKIKQIKRPALGLQYFTRPQIKALQGAIINLDPQLYLGVQMLFYCFIRPGELRHLKIENINFEQQFIEVPAHISKNKKNDKIMIPAAFFPSILDLQKFNNFDYIISKEGRPGLVQVSTKYLYLKHKKALLMAGIKGRYSFYSWKHTGVVECVGAGVNIRDIQTQLRHHSLDMVQIYLKSLGVLQSVELKAKFPAL